MISIANEGRPAVMERFEPISLDALNAKAAMLERLDNKYVVKGAALQEAAREFCEFFDVLEIEGRRSFGYETWYFDDQSQSSYYDHLHGRRRRMKVRVRRYVDARLCFVEVKLKSQRGITVKKRLSCPVDSYGELDEAGYRHVQKSFRNLYGGEFALPLQRSLEVYYERMTLVAREGGERMTIDRGLRFGDGRSVCAVGGDMHIVETKSSNGNGVADKILRGLHQHPTGACSKYCVGMAMIGSVAKCNRFLPALRKLGVVPGARRSRVAHRQESGGGDVAGH